MLRLVRIVYEVIPKRIDPRARRYFRLAIYYYLKKKKPHAIISYPKIYIWEM